MLSIMLDVYLSGSTILIFLYWYNLWHGRQMGNTWRVWKGLICPTRLTLQLLSMNYKSRIENCLVFHVLLEYDVNGSGWPRFLAYFTVDRLPYTPKLRATVGNCLWTISQVCSASSAFCLTSVSEMKNIMFHNQNRFVPNLCQNPSTSLN